ncbi:Cerevisin [Dactylellina cionopaga]|nr:Cerevisin [Dactylellina cionopaga]
MAANETRGWTDIFDEMGFDPSDEALKATEPHEYTFGKKVGHIRTFGTTMRMFTMRLTESEAQDLQTAENVHTVEKNSPVNFVLPVEIDPSVKPQNMTTKSFELDSKPILRPENIWRRQELQQELQQQPVEDIQEQSAAPWNLGRISSAYTVNPNGRDPAGLAYRYQFDSIVGGGVDAYILDGGIMTGHEDFGGRAMTVFDGFNDGGVDNNGHGTHCAGTIGSFTYGVAKRVNLLNSKVLNPGGAGSYDIVVQGVQMATERHNQRKNDPNFAGSVLSLSLGDKQQIQSMAQALGAAAEAGIHISIAAGNNNDDACQYFPGSFNQQIPSIINVGAIDIADQKSSFSNYGSCVDIYAPGSQILSTWNNGPRYVIIHSIKLYTMKP